MEIKVGRSYDDFFYSLRIALITCTLIVSIGKSITYYYFLYIILCSILIIIAMIIYDYCSSESTPEMLTVSEKQLTEPVTSVNTDVSNDRREHTRKGPRKQSAPCSMNNLHNRLITSKSAVKERKISLVVNRTMSSPVKMETESVPIKRKFSFIKAGQKYTTRKMKEILGPERE